ncbi:hypothetical protein DYBT9623_03025 [Dyadobacter sp. CECT 9623]|uniref:DUF3464 family protein n=1 Tax=Dyadobacter linearis TaxID=2823330 RepID=A0ABM8URX4_9BACT|nr:hypothetical protein [Dyadobacter sp. CECT 9623]CAG5070480.1 hypothetical protein DYBT9623_03025 [Dyadobacter sp. CECT 9623]
MMNRPLLLSIVLAGMSFGTAWAVRGQFGHEQGAAWAGAVGGLAIVLLSKRQDWYAKAFQLTLASAIGWGIGGIISYGKVVGYGRGLDFGNVYYGLAMLFVIGGLFGLIGGGLFGLTLASSRAKPANWPQLLVEMTAGAIIFYYFLIEEMGWLMTPPRSEAWAACFGMTVALLWHMIRHKQYAAIRVAVMAGFAAGFGFAFGNFLQVMGHSSGIKFNFWNVMEYSIGFFGGIGMAYGTFTSKWEVTETDSNRNSLIAPLLLVLLAFPLIVWDQSFETDRLTEIFKNASPLVDIALTVENVQWISFLLAIAFGGYWLYHYLKTRSLYLKLSSDSLYIYFLSYFGMYISYSILITAAFMSLYRIEQYLYICNFLVIAFTIKKLTPAFTDRGLNINRWTVNFLFALAFLAILTALAISSHGELHGAQVRFE